MERGEEMIDKERTFARLKKLAFERVGGSQEELKAVTLLSDELERLNVDYQLEPFEVGAYHVHEVELTVLEPYVATYEVKAIGLSGSTPKEGIITDFLYVEEATQIQLIQAKHKIVLINGRLTAKRYKELVKAEVAGIISFSGTVLDDPLLTDLEIRELNQYDHLPLGKIPSVTIRASSAMEMVEKQAKKIKLTLQQDEGYSLSHNLIATIKGTENLNEEIVFMAHYDSTPYSQGVYDNGSGASLIMEFLHYFKSHPPKRTVKFIWFGSEEKGLYGSRIYASQHEEELKRVRIGINLDMAGPILGEDRAFVIADDSLRHFVDYEAKLKGFAMNVKSSIYSSDCIPFSNQGVPTISFARFGASGCAPGHNRYDLLKHLSADSLKKSGEFVLEICEQLINAAEFPVPKSIPDSLQKEIKQYLKRT